MMVRSLLFCATLCALLTACGKPEPEIIEKPVPVPIYVPEYLLSCPEVPKPGVTDSTGQADVADYVVNLYGVAVDCRTKLYGVARVIDEHEAKGAGFGPM